MPRHKDLENQLRRLEESKNAIQRQLDELAKDIAQSRESLRQAIQEDDEAPQDGGEA
jgi:predicted  nucleic acid-binding Zn-ribbon protein